MSQSPLDRPWTRFASPDSAWRRYGLAVLFTAAAIVAREPAHESLGHQSVAIFMAAILASAWFGGVGPAILSLVTLHFVHGNWYEKPEWFWSPTMSALIGTGGYYVVGITVGLLSQMRSSAQRRARAEHAEALVQREHLRATLSCMADGVIVTDVAGRVSLMNRAAESLTGWRMQEAKDRACTDVFVIRHGETQALAEHPIAVVLDEGRVVHCDLPLVLVSRSGTLIPTAYSAAPLRSPEGQTTGAVLVFRDESQRRRAELALQSADRRKDEFLATLAHELRNPLAPICMGVELLALGDNDAQTVSEVCQMIDRQSQHMVRLIDDLLDVSRITRGKLELRKSRLDLAEVVRDAVAAARPLVDAARHELAVRLPERPVYVFADGSRLSQVITNLLNNAAKFTPPEGRIELDVSQTGAEVAIAVADSGIGIAADKLESVFEMFTQVHESGDAARGGLGIGLALVKRLVEMHGGRVEARSGGPNRGATFLLRLPVVSEPPSVAGGPPGTNGEYTAAAGRRVLVVDDNPDALESLSLAVERMGGEVRRARDGVEALRIAESFQPDVVLMDLGLPNMNGFDAARQLRREPWGREVALVATTGWGQDDDRRRTAEAGFDRHVVKPVTISALREILDAPRALRGGQATAGTAPRE